MLLCFKKFPFSLFFGAALLLASGTVRAGTATSITGLYTTGSTSSPSYPFVDSHWYVNSPSTQSAYVVTSGAPSDWASSTSGKWISATASGFPGTNVNYSYALTFNIGGTGTGNANGASVKMTLYVDDTARVYVNGVQTALLNGNSLWTTPTTLTLNSNFVIGSNTISVVVANSGGGASGVLVSAINGAVVPEVGTCLPLVGALLAFVCWRLYPRRKLPLAA